MVEVMAVPCAIGSVSGDRFSAAWMPRRKCEVNSEASVQKPISATAATALSDKPESACEGCRSEAFKPPADAIRPERLIGSA
jgi:hypothetical protein